MAVTNQNRQKSLLRNRFAAVRVGQGGFQGGCVHVEGIFSFSRSNGNGDRSSRKPPGSSLNKTEGTMADDCCPKGFYQFPAQRSFIVSQSGRDQSGAGTRLHKPETYGAWNIHINSESPLNFHFQAFTGQINIHGAVIAHHQVIGPGLVKIVKKLGVAVLRVMVE